MADVYRKGAKSVHIGTRRRPGMEPEQNIGCNLDPTTIGWSPIRPPGPRCEACFGSPDAGRNRRRPPRQSVVAAATAGILAAAVVVASVDEPVNYFPVASASPSPSATPVLVTPGPSFGSPRPSEAPVLTPRPTTFEPDPTYVLPPLPTFGPIPTWPPAPTFGPLPTLPPIVLPTVPPLVCRHPGTHLGVKDICTWPGND